MDAYLKDGIEGEFPSKCDVIKLIESDQANIDF